MATDLKGKVVLVTGASTGIGAAAARAFAAVGAKVAVHYNASREPAQQVVAAIKGAGGQAALVGGDVMVETDIKRIVAETLAAFGGRIDVLVNNAGGMLGRVKIEDYTQEHIQRVMMLNCTQVALFMREVVPVFFEFEERPRTWPDAPKGRTRREILALRRGLPVFRGHGRARRDLTSEQALARAAELPLPVFNADRALQALDDLERSDS